MPPILIIQNDPHEGAGQLSGLLAERKIKHDTVFGCVAQFRSLSPKAYGGVVVLGGAQAAYETDKYPYVQNEIDLCSSFLDAGKPIAGFCLGAQILARALGGDVISNEQKEIGWYDLTLTKAARDDPLMHDQPNRFAAYHFHGDVIKQVPNALNLATSEMTEWQLFRYGRNAYGFQYHAEADQELIETMCRNNAQYMAANGFDPNVVIEESRKRIGDFERRCADVLKAWLDFCGD
jgi:GMP synthase (glutamine-hydrolysing)